MKGQKLLECVLTGNSKLYLGKVYTEEKIKELNEEEVEKLFNNDVIDPEDLARIKAQLKWGKHTCLIMRMEHPRTYMIR